MFSTQQLKRLKPTVFSLILVAGGLVVQLQAFAQCSTGAWSSVTGAPLALGVATSPIGKKYEQSCALTIDAGSVPAFVTSEEPANEAVFAARFYLLASSLSISSGDVTVFTARNGSTVEVELRLRKSGDVVYLIALYRDNGNLTEHLGPLPIENVWNAVEVHWAAGAGDGEFDLKVNDYLKYTRGDLTNDGATISEVDLGIINAATASGSLVLDAFEIRRTPEVGLLTVNEMFGISTRASVRTIHEIVIGGFIIQGDTDKCVVVRGRGPSVGVPAGVVRLSDPVIQLFSGQSVIATNDNWQDSSEAQLILDLGMEPPDPLDSAVYACLPPGPYTALVQGVGGITGIGIVEIFDTDVGTPYLWGISTRSPVGTVHEVAIGGFIIDGDQPRRVAVRGRGPSVGVPDGVIRLSDPQLTLYDGQGTPIYSNDNWGDAPNVAEILTAGMEPPDPLDATLLVELQPGAYTAIVTGVGGVTGVGIVEVFDLTGSIIASQ